MLHIIVIDTYNISIYIYIYIYYIHIYIYPSIQTQTYKEGKCKLIYNLGNANTTQKGNAPNYSKRSY